METYQPIYDAVRSCISNGDVGRAVTEATRASFDISWPIAILKQEFMNVAFSHQRPSVLFRPTLTLDGDAWVALYGGDLQSGVAGCGDSPADAMENFDKVWHSKVSAARVKLEEKQ